MPAPKITSNVPRTVALCYIRMSFTRDENDTNSPERQRANIQALCDRMGWTPEWYKDAEGHKSGRYENNRPDWLKLKARLTDPDVVALVANDLSRLHRKTWRVGKLLDELDELGVRLMQAAPGREIDTSTPIGRMIVTFIAMQDEAYANDISMKTKESIVYRKSQGKSVGRAPFGTIRDADGYLKPIEDGAWLLPTGRFITGKADTPPEEGAIWRGYYEATKRILTLYATNQYGMEKLAYKIREEGWAFRDRKGQPRPIERDDIRRVIANWPEYGGLVYDSSAKTRPAYEHYQVEDIAFVPERAVFDLELLRKVAQVRQERTISPLDNGVKRQAYPYPLSVIT